jgi:hypothetical protein
MRNLVRNRILKSAYLAVTFEIQIACSQTPTGYNAYTVILYIFEEDVI